MVNGFSYLYSLNFVLNSSCVAVTKKLNFIDSCYLGTVRDRSYKFGLYQQSIGKILNIDSTLLLPRKSGVSEQNEELSSSLLHFFA